MKIKEFLYRLNDTLQDYPEHEVILHIDDKPIPINGIEVQTQYSINSPTKKILVIKRFDRKLLQDDIKHCKETIESLEHQNDCKDCIDAHKRLLKYMQHIEAKL